MTTSKRQTTRWGIMLFIVLVLTMAGISTVFAGGSAGLGLIAWGLSPCVGAILVRAVTHDWTDTGMRPVLWTNRAWYVVSAGAYPLIMGGTLTVGVGCRSHPSLDLRWAATYRSCCRHSRSL
jgi:hypothetical protein